MKLWNKIDNIFPFTGINQQEIIEQRLDTSYKLFHITLVFAFIFSGNHTIQVTTTLSNWRPFAFSGCFSVLSDNDLFRPSRMSPYAVRIVVLITCMSARVIGNILMVNIRITTLPDTSQTDGGTRRCLLRIFRSYADRPYYSGVITWSGSPPHGRQGESQYD